ncbi:hypothetical protein AB7Y49_04775 [Providencia vermicola]|uniref:Uncharacterized protein n=1 Tax=Providencia vermicola TaxID=333965 RepID=A0AAX3RTY1_9GAMM|nr:MULTISPECIES: hypothetical protein [Providencia]ELX8378166.1 hypothetical protein [Providencia stuartii]EMD5258982.1 hypothetical protein [Providencia stuartii]USB36139.1 hypothetical protein M5J11_15190 [Providencia vermicola]WFC05029.1 hypothetical protein PG365_09705 [Providencia vermicola]
MSDPIIKEAWPTMPAIQISACMRYRSILPKAGVFPFICKLFEYIPKLNTVYLSYLYVDNVTP